MQSPATSPYKLYGIPASARHRRGLHSDHHRLSTVQCLNLISHACGPGCLEGPQEKLALCMSIINVGDLPSWKDDGQHATEPYWRECITGDYWKPKERQWLSSNTHDRRETFHGGSGGSGTTGRWVNTGWSTTTRKDSQQQRNDSESKRRSVKTRSKVLSQKEPLNPTVVEDDSRTARAQNTSSYNLCERPKKKNLTD